MSSGETKKSVLNGVSQRYCGLSVAILPVKGLHPADHH